MRILRLLSAFFKVNLQMSLAYRADTVVNILLNLMWLGWELLGLRIIFSNTETIGGWGIGRVNRIAGHLPPGQYDDGGADLAEH